MSLSTTSTRTEIKLSVMSEQVKNIEKNMNDIKNDLRGLINKIDDHYITREDIIPMDKRVADLEGFKDWGVRIVVGAVLIAMIGVVITIK